MVKQRAVNAGDYSIVLPASAPTEASYLAVGADLNAYWQPVGSLTPGPATLPNHLYAFYSEDIIGNSWVAATGTQPNTLTHQNGNFVVSGTGNDRYAAFSRTNWASFSATPSIHAIAAVVRMQATTRSRNYFIFGDLSTFDNEPSGNTGASTFADSSFSAMSWRNSDIWNNAGALGKANAINYSSAGVWQQWGVVILNSPIELLQYDNVGRDRTFHEFRGDLKALVGFPAELSAQQINDALAFLSTKYGTV
jgi:hypothetical protein